MGCQQCNNYERNVFNANQFNQSLNNWNVSNVIDMTGFVGGHQQMFNQPLDKWNVSNVKYMGEMFAGAIHFNQPLNMWKVDNASVKYPP